MRKIYTTPSVEKIEFDYNNQVVASDGSGCHYIFNNYDPTSGGSCVVDPTHAPTYKV